MPDSKTELLKDVGTFDFTSGATRRFELDVSGYVRRLIIELTATSAIVDATSGTLITRNPGAIIPMLSVVGNGKEHLKALSWNHYMDFMYMAEILPNQVVDTISLNTTVVNSRIEIYFENPFGQRPVDTVLDAVSMFKKLELVVQFGTYETGMVSGPATDASFTVAPQISVTADIDTTPPPGGRPRAIFKQAETVLDGLAATTSTTRNIKLVTGPGREYNSFLLVAEDDAGAAGLVLEDALTSLQLRQIAKKTTYPIGPVSASVIKDRFVQRSRHPDGVQTGLYPIPFQAYNQGMDSYNLDTSDLKDLRFIVDQSTAFSTAGQITVLEGIYERTHLR